MHQNKQSQRLLRFMLVSMGVLLVSLDPSIALAGGVGGGGTTAGGLEKMVTNIVTVLTGAFGKGIATIAIMVLGIMAMFGKLEWATAVKVIIGIAVTFGAASIVIWLTGGTSFDAIAHLPQSLVQSV
ncbi:MAG: VIRB2 type IV secretion [Betaproteobacteria bacterium HGW-Betaproteobacteria-22]|nr:MAG: VIRB2 type IV secretion [Betaproteobacteria bacterium HGW-Betaproteobacteria-22]